MADIVDSDFDETDEEAGDGENAGEEELERQQKDQRKVRRIAFFPFVANL